MSGATLDPSKPLDYTKLGGEPSVPTPTQYSWLTTFLYRCYYNSPFRAIYHWLYSKLALSYTKCVSTIVHLPSQLFQLLPQAFREFPFQHLFPNLSHVLHTIFTTPQYLTSKYPYTTSLCFSILLTLLVLFDYETDLLHTPYFPIHDHTTPLGNAILTGRKIRRMLGGRTFIQYQEEKLRLGETTPTKQSFVNHYGPFVDEIEWNEHYHYHDDYEPHIIYSLTKPLTQEEVQNEVDFLFRKQRLTLLDEQFRQRELFFKERIATRDRIYLQTNWDLRDGSIIPPGMEPDPGYKPYLRPKQRKRNPIPYRKLLRGSLGRTRFFERLARHYEVLDDNAKILDYGEFSQELQDLYAADYQPPPIDPEKLKPHADLRIEDDPYDLVSHSLMRSMTYRPGYRGGDERTIAAITKHQKMDQMGVYGDEEGRYKQADELDLDPIPPLPVDKRFLGQSKWHLSNRPENRSDYEE